MPEGDAKSKLKVGSPDHRHPRGACELCTTTARSRTQGRPATSEGTSASATSIALDDELCTMALVLGFDFGNGAEAQGRLWAGPCGSPSGHIPAGRQIFQSFGL